MTSSSGRGNPRRGGFTVLAAIALLGTGCGGNLTSGGVGETSVLVSGDAPDPSGVAGPSPSAFVTPSQESGPGDQPEGEIEVEFELFLDSQEVGSLPLTGEGLRVRVDLRGLQEKDVADASVPAARYDALRIVFTEIKARVDAGLIVGGTPVTGEVRVELKNATLTVVRPLPLEIEDGDRVQLLIDLNAATWLQAVDPDLRTVAESVASQAIEVKLR